MELYLKMKSYRELEIYQKADSVAVELYAMSLAIPIYERHKIVFQIRIL